MTEPDWRIIELENQGLYILSALFLGEGWNSRAYLVNNELVYRFPKRPEHWEEQFAVDKQLEALGDIPHEVIEEIGHHERWAWQYPFLTLARFVDLGGPTARMGKRQEETWMNALESAPANGSVLVISHGRVIESGLVTCIPDGDFASWGAPFRHCEG